MACKKSPTRKRKMDASPRHRRYGKPQIRQKRGRAATQSHRANPNEKRRRKDLRPIAASRCTAPMKGTEVAKAQKEAPKERLKVLQVSFRCSDCRRELDYEGQLCTDRWCDGRAVRKEQWVEPIM